VYTIDQPDSSFKAFKAVAVLDAPIENLMAVMANPGSCVEWVHNCTESYAFGDGEFQDRFAYSVNDMPWPVTDRDYVLRIRTRGNQDIPVRSMEELERVANRKKYQGYQLVYDEKGQLTGVRPPAP
jgi:hypothetical protein